MRNKRTSRIWKEAELTNRRNFDLMFFDILGLTQGERDGVYEALISPVKKRLEKAKSLKPNKYREQIESDDD
jgi:hypothetical protein